MKRKPSRKTRAHRRMMRRLTYERNAFARTVAKRCLRKPTQAEARLWSFLRQGSLWGRKRFAKPQAVLDGYVADFYIKTLRIVLELDGGIHNEPRRAERDAARDSHLERKYQLTVHRFRNDEILDDSKLLLILNVLRSRIGQPAFSKLPEPWKNTRPRMWMEGGEPNPDYFGKRYARVYERWLDRMEAKEPGFRHLRAIVSGG